MRKLFLTSIVLYNYDTHKNFIDLARPATTPVKLKDGYYIELRHKGERKGIKLRSDSIPELHQSIKKYEKLYDVHFYGEVKKGKVVNDKLPELK